MSKQSAGPSSFETSQHMGEAPAAGSHVERAHVGSSENTTPGNGSKFIPDSVTGQNDLGAPVQAMNINNITPHASMDALVHVGEEVNLFAIADHSIAPFGLTKPIPPLSSEITQGGLEHVGIEAQTGAGLEGKTGPVSHSAGGPQH